MKKKLLKKPCWKYSPCHKLSILVDENRQLKECLKEFLSPKDEKGRVLKDGCSSKDYAIRLYIREMKLGGENDCPYMSCRQWIDNVEFDNCARIAGHVSNQNGGWDDRKVAEVLNDSRVRFDEEKALKKLRDGAGVLIERRKK